jgi:hypothetical protein
LVLIWGRDQQRRLRQIGTTGNSFARLYASAARSALTNWLLGLLDREASNQQTDGGEDKSDRRPMQSRQYWY